MSEAWEYEYRRRRYMPDRIAAAEAKLAGLYREAKRYSMDEILTNRFCVNEAWDREVAVGMVGIELREARDD